MQMYSSGSGLAQENPQRMRRMICQMTLRELRQQVAMRQAAERMLTRRMQRRTGARALQCGRKQAMSAGMAPCQRTATMLQKRTAEL